MGAATPKASNGPVEVQVSVETEVCSWWATWGRATTNTVKVMLTDSRPASTVQSTHHWYRSDPATRRCMRRWKSTGHGMAMPPSPPEPVPERRASASRSSAASKAPSSGGGPVPPARSTTQPPSLCISAWSSATVQRSPFSRVSVIVHGWKRRIWPPWTK